MSQDGYGHRAPGAPAETANRWVSVQQLYRPGQLLEDCSRRRYGGKKSIGRVRLQSGDESGGWLCEESRAARRD